MAATLEFYTKREGRQRYFQIRNSLNRLGAIVPVDCWRRLPRGSVFVDPEDEEFDEVANFSCSRVGELASCLSHDKGECKDEVFSKHLVGHIYGITRYLPIYRPCAECLDQGLGLLQCTHEPVIATLLEEYGELMKKERVEYDFTLSRQFFIALLL